MVFFILALAQIVELVLFGFVIHNILTDRRQRVLNGVRNVVLYFQGLLNVWSPPPVPRPAIPLREFLRRRRK